MSGYPDSNYPAFNAVAAELRARGVCVFNPAENEKPDVPEGELWGAFMRLAIVQLMQCDRVVALPGWQKSKGANIEVGLAHALGMKIVEVGA